MYTVFSDQHHLSLYNSLSILFEQRLGGTLYRPIGKDWFTKGYWRMAELYNNHPSTIEQYLGINPGYNPPDGSKPLNRVKKIEDDVYYIYDPEYLYYHKAITLEKFMKTKIDIVIASLPQHISSFQLLCNNHPDHPKLIYQVGNAWTVSEGYAKNIMASANITVPDKTNLTIYHQEFDLNIFKPDLSYPDKKIYSFVNCFNTADHYRIDWEFFNFAESKMPDWKFKSFGGSCRDGVANGAIDLSNKMREARFIWHVKKFGDGYGHVLHNAAAVGRPVITKISDYAGKLGEQLLIDGVTCINIDGLNLVEIIDKIKSYDDPEKYNALCKNTYENFKKVVNFDREFESIKIFLKKLL